MIFKIAIKKIAKEYLYIINLNILSQFLINEKIYIWEKILRKNSKEK